MSRGLAGPAEQERGMAGLVRRRKGKNEDAHRGGNLPFHAVHLEVFPLQLNNKMGTRTGRISIHLLVFFLVFFLIGFSPLGDLKFSLLR